MKAVVLVSLAMKGSSPRHMLRSWAALIAICTSLLTL